MKEKSGESLALLTLGLGLLSICCAGVFAGIPAIIIGHKAMAEIKRGEAYGRKTALFGLFCGYVGSVGGIIVLISFLSLFWEKPRPRKEIKVPAWETKLLKESMGEADERSSR